MTIASIKTGQDLAGHALPETGLTLFFASEIFHGGSAKRGNSIMKMILRASAVLAAFGAMLSVPSSGNAQWTTYVYYYTYYSDPELQNQIGYGSGYCVNNQEYIQMVSGQSSAYYDAQLVGYCNGDMVIYL